MWTVFASGTTVGLETNIKQVTDQKYLQIRVKTKMEQLPAVHTDKETHSITNTRSGRNLQWDDRDPLWGGLEN